MTAETPLGDSTCPNCRALNPASAVVCRSCGVNLRLYQQALPHLREREAEQSRQHQDQLAESAAAAIALEGARSRERSRRQLSGLGVALLLLAGLVIGGAAFLRFSQAQRRDRLATDFAAATNCLQTQDYPCAVERFAALLDDEPDYPGAWAGLAEARLGLAGQLATAGQWEAAASELEMLLEANPANSAALAALRDVYDRWIQDALGRGDFIKALSLRLQRDARFPDEPLAPSPTPTSMEGDL
jgi:ribosomal protein L40E